MANVYEEEILPLWTQRFGRMILEGLSLPPKSSVLDVGCATGYVALEVLRRSEDGRVIALDAASPLLDVARRKAGDLSRRRIFFRSENLKGRLAFADEVFDLVYANASLLDSPDPPALLKEFARVAKLGGRVMATLPLRGTFCEFYDIYREVLTKHDRHQTLERLERHVARAPEPEQAIAWMTAAGLDDVELVVDEFHLLFKSSREFFFAPVIEFGPLPAWKEISGKGEEMQQVFWHIKEAIDAYFGERVFQVTVKAGCVRGRRPEVRREQTVEVSDDDVQVLERTSEIVELNRPKAAATPSPRAPVPSLLPDEPDDEPS